MFQEKKMKGSMCCPNWPEQRNYTNIEPSSSRLYQAKAGIMSTYLRFQLPRKAR